MNNNDLVLKAEETPSLFKGINIDQAIQLSSKLASSTVIPREFQNSPANCFIAIEMATRLDASPIMVMQNLYIINGRPAWSAQWLIAMINRSHKYKTEIQYEFEHDKADGGLSCFAWVEDYSGHKVVGPKITLKMAQDEGWSTKNGSKWKTMPEIMIRYRAASSFARLNCPDMVMGIYDEYEVREMEEKESEGTTTYTSVNADLETGEVIDMEPEKEKEPEERITDAERKELFKAIKSSGVANPNDTLRAILEQYGFSGTPEITKSIYPVILDEVKAITIPEIPEESFELIPESMEAADE